MAVALCAHLVTRGRDRAKRSGPTRKAMSSTANHVSFLNGRATDCHRGSLDPLLIRMHVLYFSVVKENVCFSILIFIIIIQGAS